MYTLNVFMSQNVKRQKIKINYETNFIDFYFICNLAHVIKLFLRMRERYSSHLNTIWML